jgi:hypothetical protein
MTMKNKKTPSLPDFLREKMTINNLFYLALLTQFVNSLALISLDRDGRRSFFAVP